MGQMIQQKKSNVYRKFQVSKKGYHKFRFYLVRLFYIDVYIIAKVGTLFFLMDILLVGTGYKTTFFLRNGRCGKKYKKRLRDIGMPVVRN